jgi:hypothetical protein
MADKCSGNAVLGHVPPSLPQGRELSAAFSFHHQNFLLRVFGSNVESSGFKLNNPSTDGFVPYNH